MNTPRESFFIQGESSDIAYSNVRDKAHHKDTRQFIDSLWGKYKPLADERFQEEAKIHFLERFWEMYLAVAFMDRGLKLVSDRWAYFGNDLYDSYDTRQVFTADYDSGNFSYLSPWHLKGRYAEPWQQFLNWLKGGNIPLKPHILPSSKLAPLMALPIDVRIIATQRLIQQGIL